MASSMDRRMLLRIGFLLPFVPLAGCATGYGGFSLEEAVRRLLTISSQRAFAALLQENGFFESDVARIALPPQLGGSEGSALLAALLRSSAVQQQLLRLVNGAAREAADAAAPIVTETIRDMTIADAVGIVRGGPTAATDYLQRSMGTALFSAMYPNVGNALRVLDSGMLAQALQAAAGIDFAGLQQDVARKASDGIYRAIGREEAAIRANPSATGDPLLSAVFGVL